MKRTRPGFQSTLKSAIVVSTILASAAQGAILYVSDGASLDDPAKWGGTVPGSADKAMIIYGSASDRLVLANSTSLLVGELDFGYCYQQHGVWATVDLGAGKKVQGQNRFRMDSNRNASWEYGAGSKLTLVSGTIGLADDSTGTAYVGDCGAGGTYVVDGPDACLSLGRGVLQFGQGRGWNRLTVRNGGTLSGGLRMGCWNYAASNNVVEITGEGSTFIIPEDTVVPCTGIGGLGPGSALVVSNGATFVQRKNMPLQLGWDLDNGRDVSKFSSENRLEVRDGATASIRGRLYAGYVTHSNLVAVSGGAHLSVSNGVTVGATRSGRSADPTPPTGNRFVATGSGTKVDVAGEVYIGDVESVDSEAVLDDGAEMSITNGTLRIGMQAKSTKGVLRIEDGAKLSIRNEAGTTWTRRSFVGNSGSGARLVCDGGEFYSPGNSLNCSGTASASNSVIEVVNGGLLRVPYMYIGDYADDCRLVVSNATVLANFVGFGNTSGNRAHLVVGGTNSVLQLIDGIQTRRSAVLSFNIPKEGFGNVPVTGYRLNLEAGTTLRVAVSPKYLDGGRIVLFSSSRRLAGTDEVDLTDVILDLPEDVSLDTSDPFELAIAVPERNGTILLVR
jgi:hypothetical protein